MVLEEDWHHLFLKQTQPDDLNGTLALLEQANQRLHAAIGKHDIRIIEHHRGVTCVGERDSLAVAVRHCQMRMSRHGQLRADEVDSEIDKLLCAAPCW